MTTPERGIHRLEHLKNREFIQALTVAVEDGAGQPSCWHGRQGSGFCTSQTLPRVWIVPAAFQGGSIPPTGQGPQRRGSVGP
jgi:hypothetical protein